MNRFLKISLFVLLSFSANAEDHQFSGTWELVSGEYVDHEGKLVRYEDLNLHSLKVLTESHFSFVTMSGDKFWSSGVGRFEVTKTQYTESPIHTSFNSPKGKQYVFTYKKQGDTWLNSRWEDGKRVEHEVWRKISD